MADDTKEQILVKNVSGSTAGAGSGDFHQYRALRRKELFRLERLEKDHLISQAEKEFQERKILRQLECEEKTAKKAEKRKRKKEKIRELREQEKKQKKRKKAKSRGEKSYKRKFSYFK
eukprot:TRINITY_DN2498_c0_g1_i1.p1 TRINITY_DN2498_c0_g1~~TRINITY_DN2498_c0_g1_i1.p1  ORF type:complete len:118 (-),score=38.51 TRINITY_DN2498_c0_g1_i1:38-391(-)